MRHIVCLTLVALAAGCARSTASTGATLAPTPSQWIDAAGHRNARIVIDGTSLHYVDYGGSGTPLVFLAGLGNSAHVFDEFAPRFSDRFHVFAITRRGYGESDQPTGGFGTDRLGKDLCDWMDSLGIRRAVFAGHSFAGDELTYLGANAPQRVQALIYLDAAYDRAGVTGRLLQQLALGSLPPRSPLASEHDESSVSTFREYLAGIYGVRWPESEVRATRRFSDDGRYQRDATPARLNLSAARGEIPMAYERVTAPVLAIYAVDRSIERDYPWISHLMIGRGKARLQAEKASRAERRWEADGRARLKASLPSARIVALRDASHYVFISHADLVEYHMRAFLDGVGME